MDLLTGEKHLILILKKNGKVALGGAGMGLKNWCPSTVLTDLRLRGKIRLFDSGEKKSSVHIQVVDESSAGDPLLDEYLDVIKDYKGKKGETTQSVVAWVKWFRDKFKKKGYTEGVLWNNLEKKGILKNQGKKHIFLKPEIKQQLYDDVRAVFMHKKEPDAELKATVAYAKFGHGYRFYASRTERDIPYSKALIRTQIIATITFFDVVVEKRKAIGGGVMAGAAAVSAAGSTVLAGSQYGVDTLVHGASHTEASRNLDTSMKNINIKRKRDLNSAKHTSTSVQLKKEEED
jgi:hypothetical protein